MGNKSLYLFIWKVVHHLRKWLDSFSLFIEALCFSLTDRKKRSRITKNYYDYCNMYIEDSYNKKGLFPWEEDAVEKYYIRSYRNKKDFCTADMHLFQD